VIGFMSQTFPKYGQLSSNQFVREAYSASLFHPASNEIATTLSLLALSLSAGSQLMPGIQAPSSKRKHRILQMGVNGLGVDALADPNFVAFLVVELAGAQVLRSLATMVSTVRELVGTMDLGETSHVLLDEGASIGIV
jgi:hypothetical protein